MEKSIIDIQLQLDERITPNAEVEAERNQAIKDLLMENQFQPLSEAANKQWKLHLLTENDELIFKLFEEKQSQPVHIFTIASSLFRLIIKDYFIITKSYSQMLKAGEMNKLETIDMARRGIHNEGAHLLQEVLENNVKMDKETARRLFTLICVLHLREAV